MDSGLGAGSGDGTHGSDHEVLEEQICVGAALVHVVAEVGNLGGLGFALERTRVGTGGIVELGRRAEGADGINTATRSRYSSREGAGGDCERCHDVMGGQLVVLGDFVRLRSFFYFYPVIVMGRVRQCLG